MQVISGNSKSVAKGGLGNAKTGSERSGFLGTLALAAFSSISLPAIAIAQKPAEGKTSSAAALDVRSPSLATKPERFAAANFQIALSERNVRKVNVFRGTYDPTVDGKTITYYPSVLPLLRTDSISGLPIIGDTIPGADGTSSRTVMVAWTLSEILEMARYSAIDQDQEFLKKHEIPDNGVRVAPMDLKVFYVFLRGAGQEQDLGEGVFRKAHEVVANIGFDLSLSMPHELAAYFSDPNWRGLKLSPYVTPFGYEVAELHESIDGGQKIKNAILSRLSNEQISHGAPIFQNQLDDVTQAVVAALRNYTVIRGSEAVGLMTPQGLEIVNQFIGRNALTGAEMVELLKGEPYQTMISSWLQGVKTEYGLSDETLKMNKVGDTVASITINGDSILKGSSKEGRDSPLWGLMGSKTSSTMSGTEKSREIEDRLIKMLEAQTGTVVKRDKNSTEFNIHSVRVGKVLNGASTVDINTLQLVTLQVREQEGLIPCREIGPEWTDRAVKVALDEQLKAAREGSREREKRRTEEEEATAKTQAQEEAKKRQAAEEERNSEKAREEMMAASKAIQTQIDIVTAREPVYVKLQEEALELNKRLETKRRDLMVYQLSESITSRVLGGGGASTFMERARNNPYQEIAVLLVSAEIRGELARTDLTAAAKQELAVRIVTEAVTREQQLVNAVKAWKAEEAELDQLIKTGKVFSLMKRLMPKKKH